MKTTDAKPVMYPHGALRRALNDEPQIWFRSQLEADWVSTLDEYKIEWKYEPQLFTLPGGRRYLPDFHLPQIATWLEVKGPTVPGLDKTLAFAHATQLTAEDLVIVGYAPALIPGSGYMARFRGTTEQAGFALCPSCHRWQWVTAAFQCRSCAAAIDADHFYRHHLIPFHPARWAGELCRGSV